MVIRIIYNFETKEIIDILNATDGVTASPYNGVLQGEHERIIEQAIALGIEAAPIYEFITQQNLTIPMLAEKVKVMKDRAFGQVLLNEFLAENKNMDLTLEQDLSLLSSFSPMKSMLDIGAINRALEMWSQVPVDEMITQERKDKYTTMLTEYLGAN